MEARLTRHQVARGARPDATDGGASWLLLKRSTTLRLTYQIRLLTFNVQAAGARLTIEVPRACRLSSELRAFLREHRSLVRVERVD